MAYGQTGSGKTYSIGSDCFSVKQDKEAFGILPRLVKDLSQAIEKRSTPDNKISLLVSVMEIYNSQLYDLLQKSGYESSLTIRENEHGKILIPDMTQILVDNAYQLTKVLQLGTKNRNVGETKMNEKSNRSHLIYCFVIQQRDTSRNIFTEAKLSVVDLAGSERQKKTQASGSTFKESIQINKGLLTLGCVISALSKSKKRRSEKELFPRMHSKRGSGLLRHIPYRESVLTRYLSDSLGGTAKSLFIACISPATIHHEETLNTLKYALRARKIQNHIASNSYKLPGDLDPKRPIGYQAENDLKMELEKALAERDYYMSKASGLSKGLSELTVLESERKNVQLKIENLRAHPIEKKTQSTLSRLRNVRSSIEFRTSELLRSTSTSSLVPIRPDVQTRSSNEITREIIQSRTDDMKQRKEALELYLAKNMRSESMEVGSSKYLELFVKRYMRINSAKSLVRPKSVETYSKLHMQDPAPSSIPRAQSARTLRTVPSSTLTEKLKSMKEEILGLKGYQQLQANQIDEILEKFQDVLPPTENAID